MLAPRACEWYEHTDNATCGESQVAGETERLDSLERLVQNVRNLQTGCTVHTGDDTNFSFC
jgi:hypothetical protein